MMHDAEMGLDPTDIFSSSLETLYDHQPVTVASAGSAYEYNLKLASGENVKLRLMTPDTLPANWFLHASDIWASSCFLADHISELGLDTFNDPVTGRRLRLLELGAAAGLPGILIAKTRGDSVDVTVSDYPDKLLIETLARNVRLNCVDHSCRVVAHAWGSDPAALLGNAGEGFDIIIAADTLWNSSLHAAFIKTLLKALSPISSARVHLVAGLHTGRYTIRSFLNAAQEAGFEVESVCEMEIKGPRVRVWSIEVLQDEDHSDRRRWVVWMVLRWKTPTVTEQGT